MAALHTFKYSTLYTVYYTLNVHLYIQNINHMHLTLITKIFNGGSARGKIFQLIQA